MKLVTFLNLKSIALIAFYLNLSGCSGGVSLSEDEAKKLIEEREKLPRVLHMSSNGSPGDIEKNMFFEKLITDGYILKTNSPPKRSRYYGGSNEYSLEITDKGKEIFKGVTLKVIDMNPGGTAIVKYQGMKSYGYNLKSGTKSVSIKEILIDSNSNIANVTAAIEHRPNSALFELKKVYPEEIFSRSASRPKSITSKYVMKKWDKGWRIQ